MFKCKAALRLTRSAQTSPARRLTTSLCPLRFSADSSKVTSPGCPLSPESILKPSAPLPAHSLTEVLLPKWAENAVMARLESYRLRKSFRPRLLSLTAIYSLTSVLKNLENSPISKKISAGMEDGDGRLRKGISET